MRRTVADAKASRIPEALNIAPSDARFLQYLNEAIEELLPAGNWWGTNQKYRVSVTSQLLTLPPQFAGLQAVAVAQVPVTLRNAWYEFGQYCIGVTNDPTAAEPNACVPDQALFRGNYPTFKDLSASNKVRVQCDVAADVGASVLLLGYDADGNWVRTDPNNNGTWQDGETILLAQSPGTTSTTTWSRIKDIQVTTRKGQWWLYEWDGTTATQIGIYQYWETRPSYQRFLLPTIPNRATQVDLIGKLAFIPVANDTDYLLIPNLPALKMACRAVKAREEHMYPEAELLMSGRRDARTGKVLATGAKTLLDDELDNYSGGAQPALTISNAYDSAPVHSLI